MENSPYLRDIPVDAGSAGGDTALHCQAASDCSSQACEGDLCVSCSDGAQNQDETDVDCGGSACARCIDGARCETAGDCASGVCSGGTCQGPTCSDRVLNQDETDLDCGGSKCSPCLADAGCSTPRDCSSHVCLANVCQAPSCSDGLQNQDEADLDCGGSSCAPCPNAGACSAPADCTSHVCVAGACQAPTCSDGVQNEGETGIDCGAGICGLCSAGAGCEVAGDCVSGVCSGNVCQAPTCGDGVQNQDETSVDCGGSCSPCGASGGCAVNTDCASRVCTSNVCQGATCTDGVQNQDETSVDCGGACGTLCSSIRSALVHRYRFDGTGTSVTDSVGSASGVLQNTTLPGNGTASLAGGTSDQFVDLPNGVLSALTNATLEAWITWRGGGIAQPWQRIFDFGRSTAPEGTQLAGRSFLFMSTSGGSGADFIVFRYCSDKGSSGNCRTDGREFEAQGAGPLASGVRVHVVGVFDDDNDVMRVYVDGSPAAAVTNRGHLSEIDDVNVWLGRSQNSGDPELNAILHEFRIYDRVLSTSEIQLNTSVGPDPTFL